MSGTDVKPTPADWDTVTNFQNFLSWGASPNRPGEQVKPLPLPPAAIAYAWGLTNHCPPLGTM